MSWAAVLPKPAEPVEARPKLDAAALSKLERAAAAGEVDAQLELALAYDDGSAGQIERVKAAEWYARAAQNGVGVAHLRLGMLLEEGSAGRQSYTEARRQYEQAMAKGAPEAGLRLGILHLEGWGVPRDPKAAEAAIEKAANAGYQPAQLVLSDMYAVGFGIPRDSAKAVAWAEKVARKRAAEGEVRLGNLAWERGLPQRDFQLAREWYQLSAEKEYTEGMMGLAATFLQPDRTASEHDLGLRWLRLAAENGNSGAAFFHAGFLLGATPPAEAEALRWLQAAAERGEAPASEVLDLAANGRSLGDAYQYVMTVPHEERYVRRFDQMKALAEQDPNGSHDPIPLKLVQPVYPQALRLLETEGDVLVDFVVDTTGRVRQADVVASAHPAFAERALEAVRRWVFVPRRVNGAVAATHMQVPVYFRLSDINDGGRP